MTISLVDHQDQVQDLGNNTVRTDTLSGSIVADDLIVVVVFVRSAVSSVSDAGSGAYTEADTSAIESAADQRCAVYYKTADGSEAGETLTLTQASSGRLGMAWAVFRSTEGPIAVDTIDLTAVATTTTLTMGTPTPSAAPSLSVNVATNAYATANAGSDPGLVTGAADWTVLNTTSSGASQNRLGWAYRVDNSGPAAAVPASEWDSQAGGSNSWAGLIVNFVESGGGGDIDVDAASASLSLTANPATISLGSVVQADTASLALTANQATLTVAAPMVAESDDFDSALGTSSITDASTSTPDVTIIPEDQGAVSGWRNQRLRYSGCTGKTPEFTVDLTDSPHSGLTASPHGWVWRPVNETDPGTGLVRSWNTFDNNSGDPTHVFSNNSAFTDDEIEVAYKPTFTYYETQHAVAYAAASSYGFELPSSVAASGLPAHVHAQFTHDGSPSTQNNAPIITHNMYAVGLEDTGVTPVGGAEKLVTRIFTGQHASEDQGRIHAWYMAYWFINQTGTLADWVRQHMTLLMTDVNPMGIYYGSERQTDESDGDEDSNRQWFADRSGNSQQVNAVLDAIDADGYTEDIWLDVHGDYRLNGNPTSEQFGYFDNGDGGGVAAEIALIGYIETALGESLADLGNHNSVSGSTGEYGHDEMGAQVSLTLENPVAADGYPDQATMYHDYTTAIFQGIKDAVDNGDIVLRSNAVEVDAVAASLALTPYAATLGLGSTINAASASLALTTNQATLAVGTSIDGQVAEITLTANASDLSVGTAISVGVQSLSLTTYQSDLSVGTSIEAAVTGLTLTPNAATVQVGSALVTALAELGLTANPADLSVGSTIDTNTAQMALETFAAGIEIGITITGSLHQMSLETLAASVGLGTSISAFAENLELTPNGATLTLGTGITAQQASLALSAFRASVDAGATPITAPGLEYTIATDRMHYTLPVSKIHFTFEDEDV